VTWSIYSPFNDTLHKKSAKIAYYLEHQNNSEGNAYTAVSFLDIRVASCVCSELVVVKEKITRK